MKQTTKTVSVVMCTYNGAKYLREQLDSIAAQTYPIAELIIQDDGSTDETPAVVAEYSQRFPWIRSYRNEQTQGVARNFVSAIRRATGQYIALADQDDVWEPHKIATLLDAISGKPAALVHSGVRLVDCRGNPLPQQEEPPAGPPSLFDLVFRGNVVTGCTCLFHKKLKSLLEPAPQSFFLHDQWLAILACRNGGIEYCPQQLVDYRQHESNVIAALGGGGRSKKFNRYYYRTKAADLWIVLHSLTKIKAPWWFGLLLLGQIGLCLSGLSSLKKRWTNNS